MGIMFTYHGYDNPGYNMHKNVGGHHTRQNTVIRKRESDELTVFDVWP